MKALVIGGSGGLSSVLAVKALDKYKVYTLTRGERTLPEGVVSLKADRNDLNAFREAIGSADVYFDVVFDCICMNKEHAKADTEILSEYTDRLIVVSTDSVFDGKCKKTPEDENGVCLKADGDTKDCDYAQNKRQMEKVFLNEMSLRSSKLKITIFRPGHIYGPGFLLGCYPEHSRQRDLIDHIISNKPIRLVGRGTYLIHPIFVDDLAETMIDCVQNDKTFNEIFCIGGPEAVENRIYYEYIADILGADINVREIPLTGYPEAHPEYAGHLCHRIYDLSKLRNTGVKMPSTHLYEGIRKTLNK
ncbi:MAG: NAD-dependent epimerase/dehydratase family protein [Lachnospiraceae bacterium]|nr:NAD-dependent epimerase/dehydratase family protein [Lachnospiraceae bacterium]